MDWKSLRRVVTGNDAAGHSRVALDGEAGKLIAIEETGLAEIWHTALKRSLILDGADRVAAEDLRLEPDDGSVKVRWFTVAPEDASVPREAVEQQAAGTFALIGAAHARVDTKRHPMMHKTETLDVIVCVKGNVDLLLDDGEAKSLKPGDVVIQRATNHAWVNRGKETAVLVAVLMNGT